MNQIKAAWASSDSSFREHTHRLLRNLGCTLWLSDNKTEWWTVPRIVENRFYHLRDSGQLLFNTLLCNIDKPGGLVVYYDNPNPDHPVMMANMLAKIVSDFRHAALVRDESKLDQCVDDANHALALYAERGYSTHKPPPSE